MSDETYVNPWTFEGEIVTSEMVAKWHGFVYLITDTETGKKYLGKKVSSFKRKVKGSTKRKTMESDWKKYYGSHEIFAALVKGTIDKTRFKREILAFCKGTGSLNFLETWYLFKEDVLVKDEFYNGNILGKYYKERTQKYFNEEYQFAKT